MKKRASGVLLHITSLPSQYGIGDLGSSAYKFLEFLKEAGQTYWQILPLNPTSHVFGNTPYTSYSAFAGNPLIISPEILSEEGLIGKEEINAKFPELRVDYKKVEEFKDKILRVAYKRFKKDWKFEKFCEEEKHWLEDYVIFISIKNFLNGKPWYEWDDDLKNRDKDALARVKKELQEEIEYEKFKQYIFFRQWFNLKKSANRAGISIIGDMPIYVHYDSVDVWKTPEVFKLDKKKRLLFISGVPPDLFSRTGQLWGTPVYDWDFLKRENFAWWMERIRHNLRLFDIMRIDHFRGFIAYWEIPAGEKTAVKGRWVKAPSMEFFEAIFKFFPFLPIIAEDLGYITSDVREVMEKFDIAGMKVLLFAFNGEGGKNPYLPHNYKRYCVAYPSTHDTNTVRGWFEEEVGEDEKKNLSSYLGRKVRGKEVSCEFIRMVLESAANTSIIPMQDILTLGSQGRMNMPAKTKGNWKWRFSWEQLKETTVENFKLLIELSGRN